MTPQPSLSSDLSRPKLSFRASISRRFSLLSDKADDGEIQRRIRDGVELEGATPWILIFAIFIASVGLNVNSTAVIIGAMLISPLMGPIVGAGLGLAIYDFALVKRALFNLAIAAIISLVVSTLYFLISPLHDAHSELLARTTPTIWDVLIAIFGGLAGIVGVSRQEKSNVIPGVAIATALMPPVCTAGFGIATGQWDFVLGALYLFAINCVFIGLATAIGVRLLKLERKGFQDLKSQWRMRLALLAIALVTAGPSTYLAAKLVHEEVYNANARKFIAREFSQTDTQAASSRVDYATRTLEVALVGRPLSAATLQSIESRLPAANLNDTKIVVRQSSEARTDLAALKAGVLSDLYLQGQQALRLKDEDIKQLQRELDSKSAAKSKAEDISAELRAQYPSIDVVALSQGLEIGSNGSKREILQLNVKSNKPLSRAERARIENWLKVRTKSDAVLVVFASRA